MFESVGNWLSSAGGYIAETWQSAVNKLKATAREFIGVFAWLQQREHIAARDPELKAEYDRTMNKGRNIKAVVEKTTGGIDWINGQIKNNFGTTMQALPAIPVALTVGTIMGLVALMGYWIADAYKLKAKITYLESHGITGQSAIDVLTGSNTTTAVGLVALAAIAFFLTRG